MKFKLQQKAIMSTETDKDTLIITGIASDTSTDRYNEYVTPETLKSLCEQANNLNLHYNHEINRVIGTITDSTIKNNQLHIKASILPEYASKLREKLEFGINYGLSISGIAEKNNKNGALTSYDLVEISLTEEPANANTYATVQIDNQKTLKSDCLGGLCYLIEKEEKYVTENNESNNNNGNNNYVTVDDLNNALNEYKTELLNTLRDEFKTEIINDKNFKSSLIETALNEINTEKNESGTNMEDSFKSIMDMIESRFDSFEAKHFKMLDETRKPEEHKLNFKNKVQEPPSENNKKTIREIANTYKGGF